MTAAALLAGLGLQDCRHSNGRQRKGAGEGGQSTLQCTLRASGGRDD